MLELWPGHSFDTWFAFVLALSASDGLSPLRNKKQLVEHLGHVSTKALKHVSRLTSALRFFLDTEELDLSSLLPEDPQDSAALAPVAPCNG